MPKFAITVINHRFESHNEQHLPTERDAHAEAIRGALAIGVAEVSLNQPLFAAEVKVAHEGQQLARYVVSMGVSPLR
jgi:hypothetical protein